MEEILYLHAESLSRYGGLSGLSNPGQIDSALGAAQNTYWYGGGDVFAIAAAYAFHIAESQAFNDGNKRTGAAAAIIFLTLNGIRFPKDDGSVYNALIDIANKQMDKSGLAVRLRKLVEETN
jgi:death-on-curing protein